jgi:hypothetical protein
LGVLIHHEQADCGRGNGDCIAPWSSVCVQLPPRNKKTKSGN